MQRNHNKMSCGKFVIDVEEWEYYLYVNITGLDDHSDIARFSFLKKKTEN